MPAPAAPPPDGSIPLFSIDLNIVTREFEFHASVWLLAGVMLVVIAFVALRFSTWKRSIALEIDETEIGIGAGKIKLKPNHVDRQVAYQIWVELSTRKIGLDIDPEHDVIAEVYDSWHAFFGVTRDLIKSVPVNKVSTPSTKKIINLSIEVLNEGLRPHLTRWQARFRRWYESQMADVASIAAEPQDVQKRFPAYADLERDLLAVNVKLKAYRRAMYRLVHGDS